jgi:hypothetical protein
MKAFSEIIIISTQAWNITKLLLLSYHILPLKFCEWNVVYVEIAVINIMDKDTLW